MRFLALYLGMGIVFGMTFPARTAHAQQTPPSRLTQQGWASRYGVVAIQPLQSGISAREVADRMAIQEAFARWGMAYDEVNSKAVRSLFTANAVYQVVLAKDGSRQEAIGRYKIADLSRQIALAQADQRRHIITNIVVNNIRHNSATATAYALVSVTTDRVSLFCSVIYSAELRKESDGAWRFTRFVIGID